MGELQALDWTQTDLDSNLIHVERSWDRIAGFIEPKSRAGRRRVPITNTRGVGLVFPNTRGNRPFNPSTIRLHSTPHWQAAGLLPITLHECRHTYAAFMIAAGINTPKRSAPTWANPPSPSPLDRYGHLLPGNEHQAATLLDNWLTEAAAVS
jgi:integrase